VAGVARRALALTAALVTWSGAAVLPASPAAAHPVDPAAFQQVELAKGVAETGEPMALAVLPDRSVLHTARNGTLRRTDANGTTTVVGTLPVYTHDEEGLQGVAADPGFATNRHIYLYYAPPLSTPGGDAPATGTDATWATWRGVNRLSRFTLTPDWRLDPASERVVLKVPADRGMCCHVGGNIDFDADGNLYLSTGDDTNPFDSASYAPIDERTDRNPAFDAQRTSANTNDLRGKILRIRVNADGSYSIPAGNLFPPGTPNTRPEIYAMGFRNPFRMSVDQATGIVYVGDYGPNAGTSDPNRGPSGQVEFNRITSPGNYGWPYCTGTNTLAETYNEWNFATNSTGPKFDCAGGPTNNSFRNTGQTTLPPARPSWIRYGGDAGSPPEFGGGSESPMGGPVYRYDPANPSPVRFPADFDGLFFAGEFGRRWIKPVHVNADGSAGTIDSFPWHGTQVMDMAFGPDGALYVLDYGAGFGNGDANSALYRIEYIGNRNRAPVARASADRTSGPAPLTVAFSSAGSMDPDGDALTYSWAFGDGTSSTAANPTKTYTTNGTYTATLTVRHPQGATGTSRLQITVGNTAPTVTIVAPADGQPFSFGDTVPFEIRVTDPEDGTIDCDRVTMTYLLGHDSHAHEITERNGCSGTITVPVDGEHDAAANIFGVWDAEYTDNGGVTTHRQHITQPRHRQAEHFGAQSGVLTFAKTSAEGGRTVGEIHNGDWVSFAPYALAGVTSFTARVSSAGAGGTLSLRAGSPTGPLLGSATVPVTGSWDTFTTVGGPVTNAPAGTTTLYLVFTGGSGALYDVDSFTLGGTPPQPGGRIEAESFTSQSGTQIVADPNAHGGQRVGYIDDGDWLAYASTNPTGRTGFTARVSSGGNGGTIHIRTTSPTGPQLGSVTVPNTGGYGTYTTATTPLTPGSGPLYLVFTGTGTGGLLDIDSFTLAGGDADPQPLPALSPNVHLFYYAWYGNPSRHGQWRHWQQGNHTPPEDIGANFYPTLGAYDSGDLTGVVAQHMRWIRQSGAGVIVYSWWGQNSYEDQLATGVLDAAQQQGIKVAWHMEPYAGRTAASTVADITYLNNRYGAHPAFYRDATHGNRPVFYVFQSLDISDWSALNQVNGTNIILAQTTDTTRIAGFSGMYTYDAIAGATAPGWAQAATYAKANNLIWAPSVGPGYIDDRAVIGNTTPTLDRANGATYDLQWRNALDPATGGLPTWVSVTSFNEWHEGSTIEPARSTPPAGHGYLSYEGAYGRTGAAAETAYLDRTAYWTAEFENRRAGGGGNLALHKPATADSACAPTEGPEKAVNGSVTGGNADKWCSLGSTRWWRVDLGAATTVGRFVVRHAGAGGENPTWNTRDFDIQTSTDGTTWTTRVSVRGNTASVTTHTIAPVTARYLRLNVLTPTSDSDRAARIYEFEAYPA
jgi:glucose/arabinose dehydrogenase/PKD repeat protein